MRAVLASTLLAIAVAVPAAAQPFDSGNPGVAQDTPRLINGRLETHAVTTGLATGFQGLAARLTEPAWVGYAMPVVDGDHQMCDWTGAVRFLAPAPVHLEPPDVFLVLYRVEQGQVVRIRSYSEQCPLDAGGRVVHWLTGVTSADSIAFLKTFVPQAAHNRIADSAVTALAMHAGVPALDSLIGLARDHGSAKVRGSALFWLGQRAGQKAVGTISDAIDRDPDTEVKRKAVFALSQLPKDEGVPLLIQTARTNKNPAVRKQAMFWLGQSKDPRALRFFEEILR